MPHLRRGTSLITSTQVPERDSVRVETKPRGLKRRVNTLTGIWLFMAALLFFFLYGVGLSPEGAQEIAAFITSPFGNMSSYASEEQASVPIVLTTIASSSPTIIIPSIGVDAPIVFPSNREVNVLNNALLGGVVHYPGSAQFGATGNAFLFGHSTGLKVVHNKNFEVFNRVKELKPNDPIKIRSGSREYLYLVTSVENKRAEDATIVLATEQKILTLSTCNIFGGKEQRYIVTAEFVRSYPLRIRVEAD